MIRTLAVLLTILAGCGTAVPSLSPSVAPTESAGPTPTPTTRLSPSPKPSPSASPGAVPSPPPKRVVTDLGVDIERVESDLTNHVETFTSLGDGIVWSGGARDADNNLYRYLPGAGAPELVYANPNPNSVLALVRGSTAGYVFTDERANGAWRLLYLKGPGDEPVVLDESTDNRLPTPTIAMDDSWIAWEAVHGTVNDHLNELRATRVDDPLHPLTLLSFAGRDSYLAFPSLYGDELWYGIANNDWVANTEQPRVEMIDLTRPADPPAVFGADRRAFLPAPSKDVVAWKSGGTDDLAALNAGTLTLYWRATGQTDLLPIPGNELLAERISYPSVGNRFVAWWDDARTRLYVYDLVERQFARVAEYDALGDDLLVRPSLAGGLLTWLHYLPSGERQLEWAQLPS